MKKQLILFVFTSSFLIACGQINRLSKEDYAWMPYKGNETLVFKSNSGEADTVFILKKDTLMAYPEAQSLSGTEYEVAAVFCKSSIQKFYLFKVQKAKDNRAELVFDLEMNTAELYGHTPVKIDSLSKSKPITLQTSYDKYEDVYIIYPDNYAMDFYNRSDFVTKLYWSKSNGLIRYDKKDGVYWELMKK